MRAFKLLLRAVLWLILLVIASPFLFFGSGMLYVTVFKYTHHFRLVLEVEDHGVIRTGSSVIAVLVSPSPPWLPRGMRTLTIDTLGEAVVVELSTGRLAVATLGHGPAGGSDILYSLAAMAFDRGGYNWFVDAPYWRGSVELTGDLIPLIVTFDDIDDPYSIRAVPPEAFPETFGPEIRFHRMWLEMTSDRVTRRIEEQIPFLATRRDELNRMTRRSFVTPGMSLFIRGQ